MNIEEMHQNLSTLYEQNIELKSTMNLYENRLRENSISQIKDQSTM